MCMRATANTLVVAACLAVPAPSFADGIADCPDQIVGTTTAWLTPNLVGSPSTCNFGTITADIVASMNFFSATPDTGVIDPSVCGRCLRVSGPDGSVIVRIVSVDNLPTMGDLDLALSGPAYNAVFTGPAGIVGVGWHSVECPDTGPVTLAHMSYSTALQLYVRPDNYRTAIGSISVDLGQGPVAMARSPFNVFATPTIPSSPGPHDFTLTDVHGRAVTATGVTLDPGGPAQPADGQFPACGTLFTDGFESSTTAAWSSTNPNP